MSKWLITGSLKLKHTQPTSIANNKNRNRSRSRLGARSTTSYVAMPIELYWLFLYVVTQARASCVRVRLEILLSMPGPVHYNMIQVHYTRRTVGELDWTLLTPRSALLQRNNKWNTQHKIIIIAYRKRHHMITTARYYTCEFNRL